MNCCGFNLYSTPECSSKFSTLGISQSCSPPISPPPLVFLHPKYLWVPVSLQVSWQAARCHELLLSQASGPPAGPGTLRPPSRKKISFSCKVSFHQSLMSQVEPIILEPQLKRLQANKHKLGFPSRGESLSTPKLCWRHHLTTPQEGLTLSELPWQAFIHHGSPMSQG